MKVDATELTVFLDNALVARIRELEAEVERLTRAIRAEWDCQDAPKADCTALYCLQYTECKALGEAR